MKLSDITFIAVVLVMIGFISSLFFLFESARRNPANERLYNDTMWCEDRCQQYKTGSLYPDTEHNWYIRCVSLYKDDSFKKCVSEDERKWRGI